MVENIDYALDYRGFTRARSAGNERDARGHGGFDRFALVGRKRDIIDFFVRSNIAGHVVYGGIRGFDQPLEQYRGVLFGAVNAGQNVYLGICGFGEFYSAFENQSVRDRTHEFFVHAE